MARRRKSKTVRCQHFTWLLKTRNGVYQADGRSNDPPAGRHSLGTRDYDEALRNLTALDASVAVQRGLVVVTDERKQGRTQLSFEDGLRTYYKHLGRPQVTGGIRSSTIERYRDVTDKAIKHFRNQGLTGWHQLKAQHLHDYAAWLEAEGYAYRTQCTEVTVIKQAFNFLIAEGLLPAESRLALPMKKTVGSDTYCFREAEVAAMVQLCRSEERLHWLADVIIALAHTGMRISELRSLAWACVDLDGNRIVLKDESANRPPMGREARTNKTRRLRSFPIHETLREVLAASYRPGISGHVFRHARGGMLNDRQVRATFVTKVIAQLEKEFPSAEDEIGFRDGRLHSFRHYFCSWCANSGVSEHVVMHWLGHRNSDMVRHYYALHDEQAQQQMRRLGTISGLGAT